MALNRIILVFLMVAAIQLASANVIGPIIYEQKDMGDISLKEFVYSMSADCTAGTVTVSVMDENYTSIQGAGTLLSYVDFSSGLISQVDTDNHGIALLKLPGDVKLMRGMFILVVEKYGFRNKEIHFDLSPCYTNGTSQKPPKPTPPAQNVTNQTQQPAQPAQNQTANATNSVNVTNATSNTTQNASNDGANPPASGSLCPAAILMACLALMGGIFASMRKRRAWRAYGKDAKKSADGK